MRQAGTGNEFYHTDALGSSLALSNAQGSSATMYTYEPFGKTTVIGTSSNLSQYTGRENDGTGLYYYRSRYYSPRLQRFLSEDPVGFEGGINVYAYVGNQPLRYTDSSGHFVDILIDVGLIGFDLHQLATSGRKDLGTNLAALGADVLGALTPGVTGLGLGVRVAKGAKGLPDSAQVCRGGTCAADKFTSGSGVTLDASGKLQGVSVNSGAGKTVEQLSEGIPNKQVGVTTVGDVRRAGGDVIPSPTANNPNHCTLCGITPQQAKQLMTPTITNPNVR